MSDPLDRFRSVPATWDEVKERMRHGEAIRPLLEKVASDGAKWMTVYRSKANPSDLWAVEFPYSEAHGGGPLCFYPIEAEDAKTWLAQAEPFTDKLRREAGYWV
jgi:hypothetical protein